MPPSLFCPTRRSSDLIIPSTTSEVAFCVSGSNHLEKYDQREGRMLLTACQCRKPASDTGRPLVTSSPHVGRSEEHTSELQSHSDIVGRLPLEKKQQRR